MRIGLLTQWFDPEPGPAAIPGVLAREFVRAGHAVDVLTGFPNYPHGQIFPGYRQSVRSTTHTDGMCVTRVPLHPSHDASAIGRAANYATFAASAAVFGAGSLSGADALWVYNSPATVALPLLTHSRWGQRPYFLHVQDLWPDSLTESGMFPSGRIGRAGLKAVNETVRLIERRAAVIGVISPTVRQVILDRNPAVDPERIVYAPNPTDEALFRPLERPAPESDRPFTIMYTGAIGEVQALDTLLAAAEALGRGADIRFELVGDGIARQRLERHAFARGLTNVTFRGRVPKSDVPHLMAEADVHLVSLADVPFLRWTTPSKIASLLASRVVILGHIAGDGADLLDASGAALTTPPGDPDRLADAILRLAAMTPAERTTMADRGRAYYDEHLNASTAARRIIDAFARAS